MVRISSKQLIEAQKLVREVASWSEEEIEELPKLYREKARKYRELNSGEE